MFQQQATMKDLARLSRNLGVSLHSGISIVKAFELAARKSRGHLRSVLTDVAQELKQGSDVTSALVTHGHYFPELFIGMTQVGEATGAIPEVLKALAEHYDNNLRLRKEFLGRITTPALQLGAAILIIAALIALLGWIAPGDGRAMDVLGWGLTGTSGAIIWLTGWAILTVSAVVFYRFASSSLASQLVLHRFLIKLPVVGHCLRSFAIARFSWAFYLTQNAGMPIDDSLESSLRATSNGVFIAATSDMIDRVRSGETLSDAFQESDLFPLEFIEFVLVAEQSGTVPEALHRLSPQFEEDARRSLANLAASLSWGVWALVAGFIAFVIFSIVLWYVHLLESFSI